MLVFVLCLIGSTQLTPVYLSIDARMNELNVLTLRRITEPVRMTQYSETTFATPWWKNYQHQIAQKDVSMKNVVLWTKK